MSTIAVLGTLDSKGEEHAFVAERIRDRGHEVLFLDIGTGGAPQVDPDVSRFEYIVTCAARAVWIVTLGDNVDQKDPSNRVLRDTHDRTQRLIAR